MVGTEEEQAHKGGLGHELGVGNHVGQPAAEHVEGGDNVLTLGFAFVLFHA
jgi:hypothetical protein